MKPDREDHSAAPARPRDARMRDARMRDARMRDARMRDARMRDAWRRRSLAGGWLAPDDWHSEAVDAVLSMAGPHAGHGTGPAIALVPAREDLPLRYARLRRSVQATFGIQIRITPLPGRLTEALRLVGKLAR